MFMTGERFKGFQSTGGKASILLEIAFLCFHNALLQYGDTDLAAKSVNAAALALGLDPIFSERSGSDETAPSMSALLVPSQPHASEASQKQEPQR
jgi:hypothetical protein